MNDMTPAPGTALTIPEPTQLATIFRAENGLDPIIARIEAEARTHVPDTSTKKGRDAIASLAHKVARSKTMLDDAGKQLNEEDRKRIAIVDAARRAVRDRLDALKAEVRIPLDKWEAAEAARVNGLRARMRALDAGRADHLCSRAQIAEVLAEIEATEIGDDWQEMQGEAAIMKDRAVTELRRNLEIARKREADAEELERLRAEQAKRDEEARIQREAEEAAAKLAERVSNARAYIETVGTGFIGGQPQPYGILIYELQQKIPSLIDQLGEHAAELHGLRLQVLERLIEEQKADAAAKAAREADAIREAAERAAKEAEQRAAQEAEDRRIKHQRELDAAAEAERDRLAAERRAEAEAQRRREENARIRNRVKREISEALSAMAGNATPDAIADALVAGRIPHCTVRF